MRICCFPLDDAAIQTIHPKDVYLIKMADEQSMELFVMQEDLLTTYYTCHMSPYLWKRIKRAFSISKNTSNDLWEWKSSGRGDDWYWKRSIPTQYQKKLERLILLDQFWATLLHPLNKTPVWKRIGKEQNPKNGKCYRRFSHCS